MSSSDIISLNVGGQKFQTTRMTLMSSPSSTLARMFDPDSLIPPAKHVDGDYFIDADPKIFDVILHFLRYKSVVIPPNVPVQAVVDQAMFFGLNGMMEEMSKPSVKKPNSRIKINVSGKIYEIGRETLTKKIQGKMCKVGRMVENGEKEIFLDMPSKDFEIILQALRDRDFNPHWSMMARSSLEIFGISLIHWHRHRFEFSD